MTWAGDNRTLGRNGLQTTLMKILSGFENQHSEVDGATPYNNSDAMNHVVSCRKINHSDIWNVNDALVPGKEFNVNWISSSLRLNRYFQRLERKKSAIFNGMKTMITIAIGLAQSSA